MTEKRPKTPCAMCGEMASPDNTMPGPYQDRMVRDDLCFACALWSIRADEGCPTVIDGCMYTPGGRTSGPMRGCAGRRFDIEYFDGRQITSFDLWVGGEIPQHFRERIPDTARFLNGARRVQVGDITCFDESRP